jgi:PAS domain-containing protein
MATRAFWVANDVGTERERLSANLQADRQILDETEDAPLLLDAELKVLYANPAATALLDVGDGLALRHLRLVARIRMTTPRCRPSWVSRPGPDRRRRRTLLSFAGKRAVRFSSSRCDWLPRA